MGITKEELDEGSGTRVSPFENLHSTMSIIFSLHGIKSDEPWQYTYIGGIQLLYTQPSIHY